MERYLVLDQKGEVIGHSNVEGNAHRQCKNSGPGCATLDLKTEEFFFHPACSVEQKKRHETAHRQGKYDHAVRAFDEHMGQPDLEPVEIDVPVTRKAVDLAAPEPSPSRDLPSAPADLFTAAVAKAGNVNALATALGMRSSPLYIARKSGQFSAALVSKMESFLADKTTITPRPAAKRTASVAVTSELTPELCGEIFAKLQPLIEARAAQLAEQHPDVLRARKILAAIEGVA